MGKNNTMVAINEILYHIFFQSHVTKNIKQTHINVHHLPYLPHPFTYASLPVKVVNKGLVMFSSGFSILNMKKKI